MRGHYIKPDMMCLFNRREVNKYNRSPTILIGSILFVLHLPVIDRINETRMVLENFNTEVKMRRAVVCPDAFPGHAFYLKTALKIDGLNHDLFKPLESH